MTITGIKGINDILPDENNPNVLKASGCMASPAGAVMPLGLNAVYQPGTSNYELVIYSTIVPRFYDPFVIRFDGFTSVIIADFINRTIRSIGSPVPVSLLPLILMRVQG